ncbi:SEC-C metal-binding domain-containing protein [Neisseria sp. 23W00296]|uniref:SEC-C metal-binding domain-containing protein n=1 Tax=unclassified Neisseria TaxID=2623750 RepID=UPI0002A383CC|nr:SEC-C metal-binding domain-containing protein [Neisseria sp. oral taxon 020]EKY03042.1 hypothetical protein HMPREF9120_02814 [Neisseria sp. oral taxon 020 str. F0370]
MINEQQIFEELSNLCRSNGFIHVLVKMWFNDNYFRANKKGNFTTSQISEFQANRKKLNRNELNTLLALVVQNNPNFFYDQVPQQEKSDEYSTRAYKLLEDFHKIFQEKSIINIMEKFSNLKVNGDLQLKQQESDWFLNENNIREAVFYSGDGAYDFQYQDLGCLKYINDNKWFIENKGFSVEYAHFFIEAIFHINHKKIHNAINSEQTVSIQSFIYTKKDFIDLFETYKKENYLPTDFLIDKIISFISAFSFKLDNLEDLDKFQSFDDFNPLVAFPFIKLSEDKFLLLDLYTLSQAFYETPFFWLSSDNKYNNLASKNRGEFTENMVYSIFCDVFGKENVWLNVDLYSKSGLNHSKKDRIGEIDILVNIHGYSLVFQAKSKKLTINARKGNIQQIDNDFSKAIQHAYNQAFECSKILLGNDYIARIEGEIVKLPETDFCIPICVLSEHFPALTMQIRWLLKENQHEKIASALVFDVFLLDLMYKTLNTPLEFIHFISVLSNVREIFLANTQIDLLAVHLSRNLLCSEDADMFYLDNGLSADLDLFLLNKRRNIITHTDRNEIPSLSCWFKFKDTYWWQLFAFCSQLDIKEKFKFGLELLQLSGEFIEQYNSIVLDRINKLKLNTNQIISDFTMFLSNNHGLTVYVHNSPFITEEVKEQIYEHANLRKYHAKSNLWFALIISTKGVVKYIDILDSEWVFNDEMQQKYQRVFGRKPTQKLFIDGRAVTRKIGRNEPCPCNSGKKYKRCCGK